MEQSRTERNCHCGHVHGSFERRKAATPGKPTLRLKRLQASTRSSPHARSRFLTDESPDVIVDVKKIIPNAVEWLDTPNTNLWFEKPRNLIGAERERQLRDTYFEAFGME